MIQHGTKRDTKRERKGDLEHFKKTMFRKGRFQDTQPNSVEWPWIAFLLDLHRKMADWDAKTDVKTHRKSVPKHVAQKIMEIIKNRIC